MLTASQVFGARAGKHAARVARAEPPPFDEDKAEAAIADIEAFASSDGDEDPAALKAQLQRTAWENLMVARSPESLDRVLKDMKDIEQRLSAIRTKTPYDVVEALETRSLLVVGEMIVNAASMRTESRSSHYREDFPEQDDQNWLKVIKIKATNGKMNLEPFAVDPDWQSRPEDLGEMGWG